MCSVCRASTLKLLYPRFAKIAYASGVVFGRYGSVGASQRFCGVHGGCCRSDSMWRRCFVNALADTRSLKIALMAVPASLIQLYGYGAGFIKAFVQKILFAPRA